MNHSEQYFNAPPGWDEESYHVMRRSRNRAWIYNGVIGFALLGSLGVNYFVLNKPAPLPYVITVDKNTGYMELATTLTGSQAITADEAVTQSNLVRYLNARESYNPAIQKQLIDTAQLYSTGEAAKEHRELWAASNPLNPSVLYKTKAWVDVTVKSVSLLNDKTATVRFARTVRERNKVAVSHWQAVVTFRYVAKPATMEERIQNPLGFQVETYRITQENIQ